MAAELLNSDAVTQAQAVRRGDVSAAELVEAAAARAEAVDRVVNALVTPPVLLGYLVDGDPQQILEREGAYYPHLFVASQTGQPSMSIPFWSNADGLPIGVHLMGGFGDDLTLLQLAAQLEEARPWAGRRPTALEAALAAGTNP